MKLGLIIGRFQPVHDGHLSIIERSLKENDHTLILVGSSNKLPDFKNPFTAQERLKLLHDNLGEANYTLVSLKDKPTDDEWIQDVIATVMNVEDDPTQVTLYCAPKDEDWYRKNLLYPIVTLDNISISATQVRHAWYLDELWTVNKSLPKATKDFLEKHHDRERLTTEYITTKDSAMFKLQGHPFRNPMEPVSFAVITQGNKLLVGRRKGARGYGQLGLLGGYIENTETTLDGCMREVSEESGIDLRSLITEGRARCLLQSITENLDDIGTRTIGINYLFLISPDVDLELTPDGTETSELTWVSLKDVLEERELLFYNHNQVVQAAYSKLGDI